MDAGDVVSEIAIVGRKQISEPQRHDLFVHRAQLNDDLIGQSLDIVTGVELDGSLCDLLDQCPFFRREPLHLRRFRFARPCS